MKKINLGISGCMGRMGQQLIRSSKKNKSFNLKTLTENRYISRKIQGIKPEFNTEDAFKKTDLIIDFTIPKCTLEVLKIASKLKKKVVIGTTGFNRSQESEIKKYSKKIPILKALGVFSSGTIPSIFFLIFLFSVNVTNLKFLLFLED